MHKFHIPKPLKNTHTYCHIETDTPKQPCLGHVYCQVHQAVGVSPLVVLGASNGTQPIALLPDLSWDTTLTPLVGLWLHGYDKLYLCRCKSTGTEITTYQDTSFTNLSFNAMQAVLSSILQRLEGEVTQETGTFTSLTWGKWTARSRGITCGISTSEAQRWKSKRRWQSLLTRPPDQWSPECLSWGLAMSIQISKSFASRNSKVQFSKAQLLPSSTHR